MIQSKAITILKQLNKKEFIQFGKYLSSGAFTPNKKLFKLYNFLKKHYPHFSSAEISKQSIYKSSYNNPKYDDASTRKILSDFYKETELFLAMLRLRNDKPTLQKTVLPELDERKLDTLFPFKYEEIKGKLLVPPHQLSDFLDIHLLEWSNLSFHLIRGMQDKMGPHVYSRLENIIFYTLCDTFLGLQDILTYKNSYNFSKPVNLPQAFVSSIDHKKLFKYIQDNEFLGKEIVLSFYLAYLANKNFDDNSYYFRLKEFVLKNFENYHISTQRTMAAFMTNYCIRKRRQSEKEFDHELSEVYQLHIKYKLIRINKEKYIRTDVFLNMLTYYYEVGKISELGSFIEANIESIQPGHRKNTISLCQALMEFEQGNFELSLRQVSMIKSTTFVFKHKIKILILKNHFELKNYETARDLANSFYKSTTMSKNVLELQKQRIYKFLSYFNLLIKASENKPEKNKLSEISGSKKENQFLESVWILKKIDKLLKNS
ncbi:MAG: hypothetical protein HOP31_02270 [Ignavibacteria bacterium]|nr:hypothetical protein [Ignavibacteria bacterium]